MVADTSLVSDFSLLRLDQLDLHGDDSYVAIEFAGVIVGVLFYVSKGGGGGVGMIRMGTWCVS